MPGDKLDHLEAPPLLTEDTYHLVQKRIIGESRAPSGNWDPMETGACVIYEHGMRSTPLTPAHSTSLRRQLHQLVTWPGALHIALEDKPPEAFIFIRPAGVALRHTLDGFYDKQYGGLVRRHGPKRPPVALIPVETFQYEKWNVDAEAQKLKNKLTGPIGHVCLIDNNARFYDDSDLYLAASVVHAAGIKDITAIRTILYERVDARDLDANKLQVHRHAKFMKRLGKLCCNLDATAEG